MLAAKAVPGLMYPGCTGSAGLQSVCENQTWYLPVDLMGRKSSAVGAARFGPSMTTSAVSRAFCDTLSLAHFKMRHFALEGSFSSAAAENSALTTLRFSMPTKARFLILRWSRGGLGKVGDRSESRAGIPNERRFCARRVG